MKIALYSPYVPKHTGGGEKYFFDCATTMLRLGHEVVVGIADEFQEAEIRQKYQDFLGYSLDGIRFTAAPFHSGTSFWQKLNWTRQFEVIYYVTDGSFFFSAAGKNIAHIQVPFTNVIRTPLQRLKLANWKIKNANSQFTQHVVSTAWQTPIQFVHYPLIESSAIKPNLAKKEKVILNVGRFFRQLHSKRQDVLVDIFAELQRQDPQLLKGWKLVLVGAVEDQSYFDQVKKAAQALPVEFYTNLDRKSLLDWYAQATLYWHATGFEVDATREPSKVEHFGISTVEAMSYGCLPVVLSQGGQREVLGETLAQLGWQTKAECVAISSQLIADSALRHKLADEAVRQAHQFGPTQFTNTLQRMLEL
jgi:glycosyltransferase involved in cell wall biosynthesis